MNRIISINSSWFFSLKQYRTVNSLVGGYERIQCIYLLIRVNLKFYLLFNRSSSILGVTVDSLTSLLANRVLYFYFLS